MSHPRPWSVAHLHGAPMVVDAEGYSVILPGGVNVFQYAEHMQLLALIVGSVNAMSDNAALARIVTEADALAQPDGSVLKKRHLASALLADAINEENER